MNKKKGLVSSYREVFYPHNKVVNYLVGSTTPNDFLLFDICLTITNWRFLLKPPMKPPMVLGRCSTKREILEFL